MALHETPRPTAQPAGPAPMLPSGQAGPRSLTASAALTEPGTARDGLPPERVGLHRRWVPGRQARAVRSLRLANAITDPVEHAAAIREHFEEFVFRPSGSCPLR